MGNGKPAIEWVMERQTVKTDKASGIVNDANDWAVETMGAPRYPLELLLRVVTISVDDEDRQGSAPTHDHPCMTVCRSLAPCSRSSALNFSRSFW